jgi:hypothetical protein
MNGTKTYIGVEAKGIGLDGAEGSGQRVSASHLGRGERKRSIRLAPSLRAAAHGLSAHAMSALHAVMRVVLLPPRREKCGAGDARAGGGAAGLASVVRDLHLERRRVAAHRQEDGACARLA